MRTRTSTLIALTFLFIFVFSGCKKDNSTAPTPTIITGSIEPALTTGTWRVGTFIDNGTDKTNNFMDFKLEFKKDGIVTATKNDKIFTGSWWSDNQAGRLKLNMDFVNDGGFEDITHDWTVMQQSSTQIQLSHMNGEAADFLTLNKNLIK
ncbi:MAG: hypothetical protein JNJ40_03150 [Bacteroidia bacterium]|nr:hypothetical protein [Bacteroidia bacterium]